LADGVTSHGLGYPGVDTNEDSDVCIHKESTELVCRVGFPEMGGFMVRLSRRQLAECAN
jgi:hypothetical protein